MYLKLEIRTELVKWCEQVCVTWYWCDLRLTRSLSQKTVWNLKCNDSTLLHEHSWALANKLSISGSLLCTLILLNSNETKCTLKLNFKLVCQGLLNILKRRILNIISVSGGGQALYPVSVLICVSRVDTGEITDSRARDWGRGNHRLLRHLGSIIQLISAISRVIRMASNVSSPSTRAQINNFTFKCSNQNCNGG